MINKPSLLKTIKGTLFDFSEIKEFIKENKKTILLFIPSLVIGMIYAYFAIGKFNQNVMLYGYFLGILICLNIMFFKRLIDEKFRRVKKCAKKDSID